MSGSRRDEDLASSINEAFGAALAKHGGGFITGFYALVEFTGADGTDEWMYAVPDTQTLTHTAGILSRAAAITDYEMKRDVVEQLGDGD